MGQGSITKERIFQVALKTFSKYGYDGTRMEKIASEVGINKASLYFHFKSKEVLFCELFEGIVKNYQVKLNSIIEESKEFPCRQRLTQIYRSYLAYHWNNAEMDFWNMVYYFPPEMMREEIIKTTMENETTFINDLTVVMQEGIHKQELRPMDALSMAKAYYYLLTCISLSCGLMDQEQGIKDMDNSFEVLWQGIKGM